MNGVEVGALFETSTEVGAVATAHPGDLVTIEITAELTPADTETKTETVRETDTATGTEIAEIETEITEDTSGVVAGAEAEIGEDKFRPNYFTPNTPKRLPETLTVCANISRINWTSSY